MGKTPLRRKKTKKENSKTATFLYLTNGLAQNSEHFHVSSFNQYVATQKV